MLAKRIILLLTYKDGILFRTKKFVPDYRYTDNFVSNKFADEIVIINISENIDYESDEKFLNAIKKITTQCFVPITVGGKIYNLEQVNLYQKYGADKIIIGSLAYKNPKMVKEIINKFGRQFVTLSIDAKKNKDKYDIYVDNSKLCTKLCLKRYINLILNLKPGEIMINSIDRDGSLLGLDHDLCKIVKESTSLPVIASGGFGNWSHAIDIFKKVNIDGLCTSNIFHLTEKSLYSLKESLKKEKINVR